jgi:hypothetical protein
MRGLCAGAQTQALGFPLTNLQPIPDGKEARCSHWPKTLEGISDIRGLDGRNIPLATRASARGDDDAVSISTWVHGAENTRGINTDRSLSLTVDRQPS